MGILNTIPYADPVPSRWMIDLATLLNRRVILPQLLRFNKIELPEADQLALSRYVNRGTVAFLGPSHPEFFTDWMIDKEIVSRVAPYAAHWADAGVVNANWVAHWFWRRQNLIAHSGREKAKEYSIKWALAGNAVLLHPEGTVRWTGSHVHEIFGGIVQMAIDAAKRAAGPGTKPVYVVPLVSKFVFTTDVSHKLCTEMASLERKLMVPSPPPGATSVERFATLQVELLRQRERACGVVATENLTTRSFFSRQETLFSMLKARLEARYGRPEPTLSPTRQIDVLARQVKERRETDPASFKTERAIILELKRLRGFCRELYSSAHLTQEQIAESLNRMRETMVAGHLAKTTWYDRLRTTIVRPCAPRVAHVRVGNVLDIRAELAQRTDGGLILEEFLTRLRTSMQQRLDELHAEVAPITARFAKQNPFAADELPKVRPENAR